MKPIDAVIRNFKIDALKPLFEPKSIAVVGASGRADRPGYDSVVCASALGWQGTVYPVTPNYTEIAGWSCVELIADIAKPVDLAIIAGSTSRLLSDLQELIEAGVKSVLIYGNPFNDQDSDLAEKISKLVSDANIPVLGPNSIGYVNYSSQTVASWVPPTVNPSGNIAGIMQSGSIFGACTLFDPRIRYSFTAHPGQEISVSVAAMINYALSLPETRVIAIYLEIINDATAFIDALEAASDANVPVIVLKPGRSKASLSAIATHTGRLAADDDIIDAVLRKHNVLRVDSMDEWWATLCLFSHIPEIGPGKLSLTGDSGGLKAQIIDEAQKLGVGLTEFSEPTCKKLRSRLAADLAAENPVDFWGGEEHVDQHVAACLQDIDNDPGTAVTVAMGEFGMAECDTFTDRVAQGISNAARTSVNPVVACSYSSRQFNQTRIMQFDNEGIAVLDGIPNIMRAFQHGFNYRDRNRNPSQSKISVPGPDNGLIKAVRKARSGRETDALNVLQLCGINTVESHFVTSENQLDECAETLQWPLVLKTAEGHAHKTERSGIVLGIQNRADLRATYHDLSQRLGAAVTIQSMAPGGIEVALGMINNVTYGPLIMVCSGGTLVELSNDRVFTLSPVSSAEAASMVDQLTCAALLGGYRGNPPLDREALIHGILALSTLAMQFQDQILSIDINPVIVHPKGALAVDALIAFKT